MTTDASDKTPTGPVQPRQNVRAGLVVREAGDGEPLVLLHGGAGSWDHWIRNVQPLSARFRVLVPDLPGYGDSPTPISDDVDAYVEHVARAVDVLGSGTDAFHLAGFSFGGALAAGVAARLLGRIRRLALLGPGGFGIPVGRQLDLHRLPDGSMENPAVRDVLRHNLLALMLHSPGEIDDALLARHLANIRRRRFDSRRLGWRDCLVGFLAEVQCPVLLVWGEHDRTAHPSPLARAERCRAARPDARVVIVPGAGHWVQYERADEVNRLLFEFFSGA